MKTYFCGQCGRLIPGPTGAPCPACNRERRHDLMIAVLVAVSVVAFLLWPAVCGAEEALPPDFRHAERSLLDAAQAQRECFTPRECIVADQLEQAAHAELAAVQALHAPPVPRAHKPADPWQADVYAEPFTDVYPMYDPGPAAAQAALDRAVLEGALEALGHKVAPVLRRMIAAVRP